MDGHTDVKRWSVRDGAKQERREWSKTVRVCTRHTHWLCPLWYLVTGINNVSDWVSWWTCVHWQVGCIWHTQLFYIELIAGWQLFRCKFFPYLNSFWFMKKCNNTGGSPPFIPDAETLANLNEPYLKVCPLRKPYHKPSVHHMAMINKQWALIWD